METSKDFYLSIKRIIETNNWTLKKNSKCDYSKGRNKYGLIYCEDGCAHYHFPKKGIVRINKGELLLVKQYPYIAYGIEDFKHLVINFTVDEESSFGDMSREITGNTDPILLSTPNSREYHIGMEKICETFLKGKIGHHMEAVSELYSVINKFMFEKTMDTMDKSSYKEVLPAKIYMEENFAKSISISLLANLCCMSETDFRRKFNSVFNVSPINYLNSVRLNHAKAYISGGIYTVREVAGKSGFGDANYFSRFFKKHTGLTPLEYKNSN